MITERELGFLKEHFQGEQLKAAVRRADAGEPIAYIIGEWYFWDETFVLNRDCLIPRPDTELLVEHALKLLREDGYFADLCTGSGCIGLSILKHKPRTRALLCDISSKALDAARENARRIGVLDRCEFICCDIKRDIPSDKGLFDMILSNPPYIETAVIDTLDPSLSFEPRAALDGGADGMDFYRVLTGGWLETVKDDGYMILEIGYDQKQKIEKLCKCKLYRDYGGNWRVAVIKK